MDPFDRRPNGDRSDSASFFGNWNLAGVPPEMQDRLRAQLTARGIDPFAAAPPVQPTSRSGTPSMPSPRESRRAAPPELDLPRQGGSHLPLRSYQPNLQSPREPYVPARAAARQPNQPPPLNLAPRGGSARMNGDQFLNRGRQARAENGNLDMPGWNQQAEEDLAPLDRPNRDRPAETRADRRAQMEVAARASAAAAAAAAAASAAGPADAAVAFWPDMRRNLRTEADLRSLSVECAICTEISGDLIVLSCAHVLCRECVGRIHSSTDDGGNPFYVQPPPSCPFCKLPLGKKTRCIADCAETRDQRFGMPVPKTMADLRDFPLTLPEGGSNARACRSCRELRIKQAMDALFSAMLNCDEADKKLMQVPPGRSRAIVEAHMDPDFERVPEVQDLMDSINKLTADAAFTQKYAGVFPQAHTINAFVAVRRRGQNRER